MKSHSYLDNWYLAGAIFPTNGILCVHFINIWIWNLRKIIIISWEVGRTSWYFYNQDYLYQTKIYHQTHSMFMSKDILLLPNNVVTGDVQNVYIMVLRTIDLIAEQSIPFLPASARQKPVRERQAHFCWWCLVFSVVLCCAMHCKK